MWQYTKAVMAALAAFGTTYEMATAVQSAGGVTVTQNEWVSVVVATVVAGLAVWAVPNSPPKVTK